MDHSNPKRCFDPKASRQRGPKGGITTNSAVGQKAESRWDAKTRRMNKADLERTILQACGVAEKVVISRAAVCQVTEDVVSMADYYNSMEGYRPAEPAGKVVTWVQRRCPGMSAETATEVARVLGVSAGNEAPLLKRVLLDWISQQWFKLSRVEQGKSAQGGRNAARF